ncbi:MAG TPA: glycoside hydrolase family 11 protein [Acetivibrio clariflavus]|nr:glycoside hydrolase family 11 protein [Acetivibrio clariflavus]
MNKYEKGKGGYFFILINVFVCSVNVQASEVITSSKTIYGDDCYYELWKDVGNTTMIIDDEGGFSCEWSDINNAYFRKGIKLDIEKSFKEIKRVTVDYDCDFEADDHAYMGVYGIKFITSNRILEYYIIENSVNWVISGSEFMGTINVDGSTYEVYKHKYILPPDIAVGLITRYVYYSIRTSKRTSGTVSVLEHFKAWESLGMEMWNMNEVSFMVEGLRSNGRANVNNISFSIKTPDESFIVGDIDGNGEISSIDYGLLKKYLLGFIDSFDYEYGLEAADVNGDGEINSLDLALYKKYLLGIISEFAI